MPKRSLSVPSSILILSEHRHGGLDEHEVEHDSRSLSPHRERNIIVLGGGLGRRLLFVPENHLDQFFLPARLLGELKSRHPARPVIDVVGQVEPLLRLLRRSREAPRRKNADADRNFARSRPQPAARSGSCRCRTSRATGAGSRYRRWRGRITGLRSVSSLPSRSRATRRSTRFPRLCAATTVAWVHSSIFSADSIHCRRSWPSRVWRWTNSLDSRPPPLKDRKSSSV